LTLDTAATPPAGIFAEPVRAERNWNAIRELAPSAEVAGRLQNSLNRLLTSCADADMALNNLERLVAAQADPAPFIQELSKREASVSALVVLLAGSQFFSDVLVRRPDWWRFLLEQGSDSASAELLTRELLTSLEGKTDDDAFVLARLREVKRREILRIGYRDLVLGQPLETLTQSISDLADALVEAALFVGLKRAELRYGKPISATGEIARIVVLGMGKLGGEELNYSSDIDLIILYDHDGETNGQRAVENQIFFSTATQEVVRLLQANTADGACYRVDLRLRPHGSQSQVCQTVASAVAYYDREGRTWERQAMVKARPIAGAKALGDRFLRDVEEFVFRNQLTFVEIGEIKTIKGRIESHTDAAGQLETDVKTGRGGIRDVEFVLQFLQLLNGTRRVELRDRNTLSGLKKLAQCGLINRDEHAELEYGYRFLRKAEHRLQFMFDIARRDIPTDPMELRKFAIRMGYRADDKPAEHFLHDLRDVNERNRKVLHRLMLDLFPRTDESERSALGEPETDLILDRDPSDDRIAEVLRRYGFQDAKSAYRNLMLLAKEEIPFLSSLRCRHFLASIAPQLLREIAAAPDPDMALVNLEKVTASLGAKGVLWESFSVNPSLLRLYVQLCSWSQFLSEILINNPGMIDELLDVLAMARYPSLDELESELDVLLRGAQDVDPILHGFKNTKLLAIGIQDVLGKQDVRRTCTQLSQLAEVIIRRIADWHYRKLLDLHGLPMLPGGSAAGGQGWQPARYVLLALGKLGGGELGYHSDLDLVLVYEGDGQTVPHLGAPTAGTTDNFQFFSELAQRIIRTASWMGPLGRLYPVDLRLRPTGASGSLVSPLSRFEKYYLGGEAQGWEFQALTRARVVHGDPTFAWRMSATIRKILRAFPWRPAFVDELLSMRKRLEQSRKPNDLKRGVGGVADVEFAVQLMQLRHCDRHPSILEPNIWRCLTRLGEAGLWGVDRIGAFREGYTFLRRVESRIRIVQNLSRNDLPENDADVRKLALRMGDYEGPLAGEQLRADVAEHMKAIRAEFLAALDDERTTT
jgi:[glutamine synthetase] adenylyltransferase / [glutamine synthetase]-adenylyl-L-tyrosine phosphorylase